MPKSYKQFPSSFLTKTLSPLPCIWTFLKTPRYSESLLDVEYTASRWRVTVRPELGVTVKWL
jgi:hypothetical protein